MKIKGYGALINARPIPYAKPARKLEAVKPGKRALAWDAKAKAELAELAKMCA